MLKHIRDPLLVLFFCFTNWSSAETFMTLGVNQMCARADGIIIGEHLQDDTVKVTKWIKAPPSNAPATIVVPQLNKHSKSLEPSWAPNGGKQSNKTLTSRHLVAFLNHYNGEWYSMTTIDYSGQCGSSGVVWIMDGRCYRYYQGDNPGPYQLQEDAATKTENELLQAIETGIDDGKKWKKTLTIRDPALRAQALAQYTLLSTSPDAPRQTYEFPAKEALNKLRQAAVPALRAQMGKWRPGDSLDLILWTLRELGRDARKSVPDLIPLLNHPERADLRYVLNTIGTCGDSSNILVIKPFLNHSDQDVREAAEAAITKLSDAQPH